MSVQGKSGLEKPVVTLSTLGKRGRFGNQVFQYAFLKIYAKINDLKVETPEWIGRYLFGHNDQLISRQLPVLIEETLESPVDLISSNTSFRNIDFVGFFHYHTKYYAQHKDYFCSLFKPVPELEARMLKALDNLRSRGKTVVGLHLRRSDFGRGGLFVAPSEWYKEWLTDLWEKLDSPILFIASDELEKVLVDFAQYNPVSVKDLDIEIPEAEFYPDFYILSQCDAVAISNSSFSFAACMLNERGKIFARPHLTAKKLIPFDPWNSEPILHRISKIYLIIFPDWSQPEDSLFLELEEVIQVLVKHPEKNRIILLIDTRSTSLEEADLILSSVTMSLLLKEDLDVDNGPEVFLIGEFNELQWEYVLAIVHAHLILVNENKQALSDLRSRKFPSYTVGNFKEQQSI